MTRRQLFARWILGGIGGTLLVWATSPLFVSSIQVLQFNATRGAYVHPPGSKIRWRSEGYATTQIGPAGMPGQTASPTAPSTQTRIALWGDSQLEGVCVADTEKIFYLAGEIAGSVPQLRAPQFLPLARSGETIVEWYRQMPAVEQAFDPAAHVIVLTELSDLEPAVYWDDAGPGAASPLATPAWRLWLARQRPDFLSRAARNLIRDPLSGGVRKLRFAVGPVQPPEPPLPDPPLGVDQWRSMLARLQQRAGRPVLIVYAPQIPAIVGGRVVTEDPHDAGFENLLAASADSPVRVIDVRPDLIAAADEGAFPHGFHNGRPGVGHLNERGNRIVAEAICTGLAALWTTPDPT